MAGTGLSPLQAPAAGACRRGDGPLLASPGGATLPVNSAVLVDCALDAHWMPTATARCGIRERSSQSGELGIRIATACLLLR